MVAREVGPLMALGVQADRVSTGESAVKPDGANDLAFRVRLSGDVVALFLTSSDPKGVPWGSHRWDTVPAGQKVPEKMAALLGYHQGAWSIAAYDGADHALNPEVAFPPGLVLHDEMVTLYVADPGGLHSGYTITLLVLRSDGSLDRATTSLV